MNMFQRMFNRRSAVRMYDWLQSPDVRNVLDRCNTVQPTLCAAQFSLSEETRTRKRDTWCRTCTANAAVVRVYITRTSKGALHLLRVPQMKHDTEHLIHLTHAHDCADTHHCETIASASQIDTRMTLCGSCADRMQYVLDEHSQTEAVRTLSPAQKTVVLHSIEVHMIHDLACLAAAYVGVELSIQSNAANAECSEAMK